MKTRFTLAAFALLATPVALGQTVIDNMNEGEFSIDGNSFISTGSTSNIIGGSRFVGSNATGVTATREVGSAFTTLQNTSGAVGTFTFDYGDFDGGVGELNSDFTANGNRYFVVEIPRAVGSGQLRLDVLSTAGGGAATSQSLSGAGTYYFDMLDDGFTDVDFLDIDRVTFRVLTTDGSEVDVGPISVTALPAPGAGALLGLAAVAATRRRR